MERNTTTINVSKEVSEKINRLKDKWKLKTQHDVIERMLKDVGK